MPSQERLQEAAKAAVVAARRHHLSAWETMLNEHRHHRSFRPQTWAHSLEWGFTCECSGSEQEWRVSISSLRLMEMRALTMLQDFYRQNGVFRGPSKRKLKKSDQRAKILLHQFLTKAQRLELKKTKAFTMQAADGEMYLITAGSCNNVKLLKEGKVKWSYCVVFKEYNLPVYDLMLAQKLMLENEPDLFKQMAYVYEPHGGAPLRHPGRAHPQRQPELTDEELEDPREWMLAQMA